MDILTMSDDDLRALQVVIARMLADREYEAIKKDFKDFVTDPATDLKFTATQVDVAKSGDLGYTRGTYTLTVMDPQTKKLEHDHGSYVTTYRKQPDGSWKAVMDIASTEVPLPAPAATDSK